eukprot:3736969-Heterocapsa_arctica.AAC.1
MPVSKPGTGMASATAEAASNDSSSRIRASRCRASCWAFMSTMVSGSTGSSGSSGTTGAEEMNNLSMMPWRISGSTGGGRGDPPRPPRRVGP